MRKQLYLQLEKCFHGSLINPGEGPLGFLIVGKGPDSRAGWGRRECWPQGKEMDSNGFWAG